MDKGENKLSGGAMPVQKRCCNLVNNDTDIVELTLEGWRRPSGGLCRARSKQRRRVEWIVEHAECYLNGTGTPDTTPGHHYHNVDESLPLVHCHLPVGGVALL